MENAGVVWSQTGKHYLEQDGKTINHVWDNWKIMRCQVRDAGKRTKVCWHAAIGNLAADISWSWNTHTNLFIGGHFLNLLNIEMDVRVRARTCARWGEWINQTFMNCLSQWIQNQPLLRKQHFTRGADDSWACLLCPYAIMGDWTGKNPWAFAQKECERSQCLISEWKENGGWRHSAVETSWKITFKNFSFLVSPPPPPNRALSPIIVVPNSASKRGVGVGL